MTPRRTLTLALILAKCVVPLTALAQIDDQRNFDGNRFRPSMSVEGILNTESAETPGHLKWDFSLWYHYENDPLVLNEGRDRAGAILSDRHDLNLVLAVGLLEFLQIGLDLPFTVFQDRGSEAVNEMGLEAIKATGLGNLAITPKAQLLRTEEHFLNAAVLLRLNLPTRSSAGQYLGSDSIGVVPELALSRRVGSFQFAVNAAFKFRDHVDLPTLSANIANELVARAGVAYDFRGTYEAPFRLNASFEGFTRLSHPFGEDNLGGAEWAGSADYFATDLVSVFLGGGSAVFEGYTIPDWRMFGGVRFAMRSEPSDRDDDGLLDSEDQCPDQAEDPDGFEDANGCPDPDNDGDLVLDIDDRAPFDPEDRDGFEDADGRPDPDNDGDGVLDAEDRCPVEAGITENEGCPEEPAAVAIRGCQFELDDRIYFVTSHANIEARSFELLDKLADLVKENPQIKRIRVEGHTDSVGSSAYNERLSRDRAQAVRSYLVEQGVTAERLKAVGLGESRPIADNETPEGRRDNRRVELHIEDCEPSSSSD